MIHHYDHNKDNKEVVITSMWRDRIIKNRKGFTGLEAAIVLIAFVTVAAIFSYVMLGAGFFTAQKGKQSVDTGVKQASSALELDGQYIYLRANKTGSDGDVKEIYFYVTLTAGGTPVDLNNTVLAIRWEDDYVQIPYNTTYKDQNNNTYLLWNWSCIVGDKDNLLELHEKYKIKINITAIKNKYSGLNITYPKVGEVITIELKPPVGAPLILTKIIPPSLQPITYV